MTFFSRRLLEVADFFSQVLFKRRARVQSANLSEKIKSNNHTQKSSKRKTRDMKKFLHLLFLDLLTFD